MTWQVFRIAYELESPLHIGYHKIGNVQRTRYYLPARNLWGAVTEKLTRGGFTASNSLEEGNYVEIGNWVKRHCAFTYWFLQDGESLLVPCLQSNGTRYGSLLEPDFERQYLTAHVTTALDAATTSAETGSLHEVEMIAPYSSDRGRRTSIAGWLFLDETAINLLGDASKWKRYLREIHVGGERRYGFGKMRLSVDGWQPQNDDQLFDGYRIRYEETRPQIRVPEGKPLLAHTFVQDVNASGVLEPWIGRETVRSSQFGGNLTPAQICWAPGSICETTLWVEVTSEGIWKRTIPCSENQEET